MNRLQTNPGVKEATQVVALSEAKQVQKENNDKRLKEMKDYTLCSGHTGSLIMCVRSIVENISCRQTEEKLSFEAMISKKI